LSEQKEDWLFEEENTNDDPLDDINEIIDDSPKKVKKKKTLDDLDWPDPEDNPEY